MPEATMGEYSHIFSKELVSRKKTAGWVKYWPKTSKKQAF